jgi:ribosomal protein S17E
MGRIKTLPIKRVTKEIFGKYKDKISGDYSKNKEFLSTAADIKSKKIRNIIAG